MLSREERIVSELLLSRGRVSKEELERCVARRQAAGSTATLVGFLVETGKLDAEAGARISDEARAIDSTLSPERPEGQRIGDFRLVREIGRGGMGVVYEAVQEPLDRRVALKVLPAVAALDERPAIRFLREARVVAGLDHPGILEVYTSGQVDGRLFYAMELVDGRDLGSMLEAGPIEPDEAARIAAKVAEALGHAHEAGLVHRDVKPANVLIDAAGRVRIMDFGLVKESQAGDVTLSHHVLGTPAFMAPEQARGEEVDPRSDVYGVGALLYAMLAGRPPYPEQVPSVALAHLLTREPEPLESVRPGVPRELAAIAARAMARSPGDRPPTAAALADDLERYRAGRPTPRERRHVARWLVVPGLLAVLALLLLWSWRPAGRSERRPPVTASALMPGRPVLPEPGFAGGISVSADGERIAYEVATDGGTDVLVQDLSGGEATSLTRAFDLDPRGAALSPDGRWLAFCGRGLELLRPADGTRRTLFDECSRPAWSPDGGQLAMVLDRRLFAVSVADGAGRVVSSRIVTSPSWSPHGTRIAGVAVVGSRWDVVTLPSSGGRAVPVTHDVHEEWDPVWSPDGRTLYFGSFRSGRAGLWRVAIDEESGEALGAPEPLPLMMTSRFTIASARDRERLALGVRSFRDHAFRVRFDPRRSELATWPPDSPAPQEPCGFPAPSPTERALLVVNPSGDGSNLTLLAPAEGSAEEPWRAGTDLLREEALDPRNPRWSPDGRRVAFDGARDGHRRIWLLDLDRDELTPLTRGDDVSATGPVWSPGAREIAYATDGGRWFLGRIRRGAERWEMAATAQPERPGGFVPSSWSPDGSQLAGSGRGIVLYSRKDATYRQLTPDGRHPVWIDGTRLLFVQDDTVRVVDTNDGRSVTLFSTAPYALTSPVLPDRTGSTLYFSMRSTSDRIWIYDPPPGQGER